MPDSHYPEQVLVYGRGVALSFRNSAHRSERALLISFAGQVLKYLSISGFYILLPGLQAGLGLTNAQIGLVSTSRNAASAATCLPAGAATDRLQGNATILVGLGLILCGLSMVILGLATSLWVAVAGASAGGIGMLVHTPASVSLLAANFPERRSFAIAIFGAGGSVGQVLAPLAAGGLAAAVAWETGFLAMGVPVIAGGVVIWVWLSRLSLEKRGGLSFSQYLSTVRSAVSNRLILLLLALMVCYGLVEPAIVTFLPIHLEVDRGYNTSTMALFIAGSQVAGIFSQPALGHLSDKIGRLGVLAGSFLLLGATALAVPLVGKDLPLLLAILAMGVVLFPLLSLFFTAVTDEAGEGAQGTALSLTGLAFFPPASVSPFAAGLLADAFSVGAVFYIAGGIALGTGLIAVAAAFRRSTLRF